jgi:L-rhamnose mutarotase
LNEDLLLSIKGGSIDSANFDNKKIMASLNKLKSSNEEEYSKIHKIIDKVMRFIERHRITNCSIDFKILMQLQEKKVLSNHQIISAFANKAQIIANHRIVGLQYYTQPEQKGKDLAAQKITSLFKMIFSKRFYKNLNGLLKKVKIIQKYWRMSLLVRKTRRNIL